MMLIADRRSWRSQAYCSGVWPEGAQVRQRTGWSMKPLSSKKKMGVSLSRAPFLSVASLARANVVGPLRRIPLLAARASDKSNSSRVESSRRDRGDRKPEKFWRSSPPHVRRSKARFCNRHVAARPEGFLTTVVFVLRRDEVWGRDGALPSGHPSRLSSRPASIALQKTWKPLQSPQPRRFPCLPAGVVPLADGESPTRLRFRAFSCTTIRINTAYGSLAGQKSIIMVVAGKEDKGGAEHSRQIAAPVGKDSSDLDTHLTQLLASIDQLNLEAARLQGIHYNLWALRRIYGAESTENWDSARSAN